MNLAFEQPFRQVTTAGCGTITVSETDQGQDEGAQVPGGEETIAIPGVGDTSATLVLGGTALLLLLIVLFTVV